MSSFVIAKRGHFSRACWALVACLAVWVFPAPSAAQSYKHCTVSSSDGDLGSHSSLALATESQTASGSGGLVCTTTLSLLSASYLKVKIDSSTFLLKGGPDNQTIPFVISGSKTGDAIAAGTEFDFSSLSILTLFSGPGGSVPLYMRISPQAGLKAGTYTGTVNLRWYFSVCTLGLLLVCDFSQSPGLVRPILFDPLKWGTGVPSTLSVKLVVEKDCAIAAPDLNFGSAPFAINFAEANQTIQVRCSAGASYSVGLSDGNNFDGTSRRMYSTQANDYLRYEIYQTPSSPVRWGHNGAERRSSATAQVNPNLYDGVLQQGYTYKARIDPTQTTPGTGHYADTIVLDIAF